MIRVGLIGYGYWGPNLLRNFVKQSDCVVVAVADQDPGRLRAAQHVYPGVAPVTSSKELIAREDVDAVVVSTPLPTHYPLAKAALERGKHVFVEKPLCQSVREAQRLVELAERKGRILMVDHTFIYSGAVRKIRELIDRGELGDLRFYDSVRINFGLFSQDTNVIWDLAPHDFAIMRHLIDEPPVSVAATCASPVRWKDWNLPSLAYLTVRFANELIAHFHVNWLSPVKIRQTILGGSRRTVVFDHMDPDYQVKVYERGLEARTDADRHVLMVQYRTGDMVAPKIDAREALEFVCGHFVDCVRSGNRPLTGGHEGLEVVRLLEAAQRSFEKGGKAVRT